MPLNPGPDDPIRDALRPFRVDPARFEAGIRARLDSPDFERSADPLAGLSPWLRAAAAFLPLPLIAGCRVSGPAASSTPAAGGFKIMSYLAFPAISLFVLLGATVAGVAGIQNVQGRNQPSGDQRAMDEAMVLWWRRHLWGAILVYATIPFLTFFDATWLLFACYVVSAGVLVLVLASLARRGLGDRHRVGLSCMMGLGLLWMVSSNLRHDGDIHLSDPHAIPLVLAVGVVLTCALSATGRRFPGRCWMAVDIDLVLSVVLAAILLPMTVSRMAPTLWPITPARIRSEVESFDSAPYSSVSWRHWGIAARWAVEAGLRTDMAKPRRLLNQPGEDGANPFVLGAALQAGLDLPDRPDVAEEYAGELKRLLDVSPHAPGPEPIGSLAQSEWVICEAARTGSLTAADRDHLERRLHATMAALLVSPYDVLEESLLITRLLGVIGRPVPPDRYRAEIHAQLLRYHSRTGGGFFRAGGFKRYRDEVQVGDPEATEYAIELMEVYGVPDGLDLDWVRSYVRPTDAATMHPLVLAVARLRLGRLPGVRRPTAWDWISYERSLIAAVILVGLCCYAVWTSPRRPAAEPGSELVGRDDLAAGSGGDGAPGGEAD